ncbi:hypothetical protein ACFL35_18340 [Candidatus Riflebacteria bacterium]
MKKQLLISFLFSFLFVNFLNAEKVNPYPNRQPKIDTITHSGKKTSAVISNSKLDTHSQQPVNFKNILESFKKMIPELRELVYKSNNKGLIQRFKKFNNAFVTFVDKMAGKGANPTYNPKIPPPITRLHEKKRIELVKTAEELARKIALWKQRRDEILNFIEKNPDGKKAVKLKFLIEKLQQKIHSLQGKFDSIRTQIQAP